MTKLRVPTIPASYQLLDDRVTDADQFANVRDLQKARENYNILLARRVHYPIATIATMDDASDGSPMALTESGVVTLSVASDTNQFSLPIYLPPFTKHVTVWMNAASSDASGDVNVYPSIGSERFTPFANSNTSVTVTGTSYAEYEVDVPIRSVGDFARAILTVFFSPDWTGSDLEGGAISIADSGADWVLGTSVSSGGSTVYFNGTGSPLPRQILSETALTIGGTNYWKIIATEPWDQRPIAGTHTYNTRNVPALNLKSFCAYPKAVSDFYESVPI
jgi:hypothetical protein